MTDPRIEDINLLADLVETLSNLRIMSNRSYTECIYNLSYQTIMVRYTL